ncbi:uncharacterized protein LOC113308123 [Papaver somniferum]|uniref:uncharacterized protein LOC113308123 n=1 Tax=Papaver somniferum TaxID=3469 RepID=UPI000E6F4E98|nr:uncharacterized protein LOC113308123 [Papaver somniferum]XP_026412391.1 uncharacterized protein LOC113308123 [Papaver somniferum]XP_026412392.1 uncharacterized protein LOC113308123 [Papaver somniferum]XP_026412393.1 uncharacterized protein LOC113308123 [Papaver somniferum]XP_026412395.1 uncharacterized protein LOC113308123 [Papaver somniferum]XP_026412396.1 uncharacterized protein LOC113308123 [Papaver somniferum]XP_026412397.1 uncharacterized protein LOC113308123 [Papaver somniferum]XP_0
MGWTLEMIRECWEYMLVDDQLNCTSSSSILTCIGVSNIVVSTECGGSITPVCFFFKQSLKLSSNYIYNFYKNRFIISTNNSLLLLILLLNHFPLLLLSISSSFSLGILTDFASVFRCVQGRDRCDCFMMRKIQQKRLRCLPNCSEQRGQPKVHNTYGAILFLTLTRNHGNTVTAKNWNNIGWRWYALNSRP